ncbi:MAG: M61 family metallopeptidase, partial [Sphingobacterium sp.]
ESLTARNENELTESKKINKNTWRIKNDRGVLKVNYRVYGFEVSVRTNFVDSDHAYLNPPATFMYIEGAINHHATVEIALPEYWKNISTGLPCKNAEEHLFFAENFDILFDSPIEIGNQDTWTFDAAGVQHEFAMVGGGNYNKNKLTEDVTKIIETETALWGENPNARYVFITHNRQNGGGGLEHLNSTVLGASRFAYHIESSYKNYLSLVAHEYFHLWNVKRLRPEALGPFNYNEENYTEGLWMMEGFTSYYDNLVLRRCGFFSVKEYLNALANEFNLVYARPGHRLQSAAESSFDTWIKHYRQDENSLNSGVSYYNKGAMHSVALDIEIISHTNGTKRLDDVLRAAYKKFYKEEQRGFQEEEFLLLAEDITGVSLSEIFRAAHDAIEIDYNKYFQRVGYNLVNLLQESQELQLGIKTTTHDGRLQIKNVERDSAAWQAGLNVDDELIAINGNRLDNLGKEMDYVLSTEKAGDIIDVLIARDSQVRTIPVPLLTSTKSQWVIEKNEDSSVQESALGDIWLSI